MDYFHEFILNLYQYIVKNRLNIRISLIKLIVSCVAHYHTIDYNFGLWWSNIKYTISWFDKGWCTLIELALHFIIVMRNIFNFISSVNMNYPFFFNALWISFKTSYLTGTFIIPNYQITRSNWFSSKDKLFMSAY